MTKNERFLAALLIGLGLVVCIWLMYVIIDCGFRKRAGSGAKAGSCPDYIPKQRFVEEFWVRERRQDRLNMLLWVFSMPLVIVVPLLILGEAIGWAMVLFWLFPFLVPVVLFLRDTFHNWRCPACERMLPLFLGVEACPSCGFLYE